MASLNESEALREIEQIKKLIAARSEPGAATHPRLSPSTAPGEGSDVEMAELPERPSRKGKEKEVVASESDIDPPPGPEASGDEESDSSAEDEFNDPDYEPESGEDDDPVNAGDQSQANDEDDDPANDVDEHPSNAEDRDPANAEGQDLDQAQDGDSVEVLPAKPPNATNVKRNGRCERCEHLKLECVPANPHKEGGSCTNCKRTKQRCSQSRRQRTLKAKVASGSEIGESTFVQASTDLERTMKSREPKTVAEIAGAVKEMQDRAKLEVDKWEDRSVRTSGTIKLMSSHIGGLDVTMSDVTRGVGNMQKVMVKEFLEMRAEMKALRREIKELRDIVSAYTAGSSV